MTLRAEIQNLAHEFDAQDNAAFDLWTWLPSHREATKYHGDYASEFMPGIADIMIEASMVLCRMKNGNPVIDGDPNVDHFQCPCEGMDEGHIKKAEELKKEQEKDAVPELQ